jgi:hypothetical protein
MVSVCKLVKNNETYTTIFPMNEVAFSESHSDPRHQMDPCLWKIAIKKPL